jgi:tetratricopeptide (TPR) repeat protein
MNVFTLALLNLCLPLMFAQTVDEYVRRGDEWYARCQNDSACAEYERAYRNDSSSFQVLKRMTMIYNDKGRILLHASNQSEPMYRKAIVYAERLDSLYPLRAESHFWFALCKGSLIPFQSIKEKILGSKDVLHHLQEAVRIDSTMTLAYVLMGIFWRETASLSWFEKAFVRIVYGESFDKTYQDSENILLLARHLDRQCPYVYYELYWTYKAMDKHDLAIDNLGKVLAISPANLRERVQQQEAETELKLAMSAR